MQEAQVNQCSSSEKSKANKVQVLVGQGKCGQVAGDDGAWDLEGVASLDDVGRVGTKHWTKELHESCCTKMYRLIWLVADVLKWQLNL